MLKNNSSILLVSNLTTPKLFIGIFFLLFKIKVVYLNATKYFRKKKAQEILNNIGFVWLKLNELEETKHRNEIFNSERVANSIVDELTNSSIFTYIIREFRTARDSTDKFKIVLNDSFINYLVPVSQLYEIAYILKEKFRLKRIFIFDNKGVLYEKLRREFKITDSVVIPDFSFVSDVLNLLKGISKKLKFQPYHINTKKGLLEEDPTTNVSDCSKYEVAYFPHKGIFYGDLFIKDNYYSSNPDSDFHPSKILHISLGEDRRLLEKSIKYYRDNNIPYADLNSFNIYSWKIPLNALAKLFGKTGYGLIKDLYKYGFTIIFLLILSYLKIIYYLFMIEKLTNLKVALAGYDILLPRELSVALSSRNVITFAVQERFINSFVPLHYYITYDYYVIAGEKAKGNFLSKAHIPNLLCYGLPRVDNIYYWANNKKDDKYELIKKQKKIVLVLDYHVERDVFDDAQIILANVKNVRKFYLDILRLADSFQEAVFVIKGKLAQNCENPILEDIVEQIDMRENVFFELDLVKCNPYYMAARADLAIALYTSLCDEMLAARKPVLIYDFINFPGAFFNYGGLPFIVKDFSSLYMMTERILRKGEFIDDNSLDNIIMEYYSNCFNGKVKAKIVNKLEQLLRQAKNIE